MIDQDFYDKWNAIDQDRKNISECVRCEKSYYDPMGEAHKADPHRYELRICRECFYTVNKNRTSELELLFHLIDTKRELYEVIGEVDTVYHDLIQQQRTQARIELDEYQKTQGFTFFGPQPRPEGFVGDQFEPKCNIVFGLDLGGEHGVSGSKDMVVIPPTAVGDCG